MAITVSRKGFAQVEPNILVANRILAQLPCAAAMGDYIENGRFAKYDYAAGEVNTTCADGEWMLIYNEESHYDEREQSHKDFCMKKENYIDGVMVPRLIGTELGDIITTNAFVKTAGKNSKLTGATTDKDFDVTGPSLQVGDFLKVGTDGYLVKGLASDAAPVWKVIKEYTMADGQPGVKIIRVK